MVIWRLLDFLLDVPAALFWRIANISMDASLFFQRLDLKVYEHIDPEGVKERRRQLLLLTQQKEESKDTW